MKIDEHRRLHERERLYWWHIGRRRILDSTLKQFISEEKEYNILDVGCGAGSNVLFLGQYGNVTGLDISEGGLLLSKDKGFKRLVLGSILSAPFPDNSFDIISILDVIEHIKDDQRALSEVFRALKQDGILLLTVPAHPCLWSIRDEALEHFRRYTDRELHQKIINAGFTIKKKSHFILPGVPVLLFHNMLRRIRKTSPYRKEEVLEMLDPILPRLINSFLIAALSLERYVIRYASIPIGTSLLVIAQKHQNYES